MTEIELNNDWFKLKEVLGKATGKEPKDLNAVLFLIGVQELGKGPQHFSKEEKQDLMHIATCVILATSNYFTFSHRDDDGWPHYKQTKAIDKLTLKDQTRFLKEHIIQYAYENHLL